MASQLYWREFTRDGRSDVDHLADSDYLATKFTDSFGKWLQQDNNASKQSFDKVVRSFLDVKSAFKIESFMVADGGFFDLKNNPNAAQWFQPRIRIVTLVTKGASSSHFSPGPDSSTLCIVGGQDPTECSRSRSFLQVASWDGLTVRYYQNTFPNGNDSGSAWNYFGESSEAFGPKQYLGPFNGHINGACIMKELHKPWLHWHGGAPATILNCIPDTILKKYELLPYITIPGSSILSAVNRNPNELENAITNCVRNWYSTRKKNDFLDPSMDLLRQPKNIPRWVSHLFLTTTINMSSALQNTSSDSVLETYSMPVGSWVIPNSQFYSQELLSLTTFSELLPPNANLKITFKAEEYYEAAEKLGLRLLQQVRCQDSPDVILPWEALGGDKRIGGYTNVYLKTVLEYEGEQPFNLLHTSFEDAHGTERFQTLGTRKGGTAESDKKYGLFSEATFNAIMMVDFCNPIYSWRRGVLMQYVPRKTKYNASTFSYDIDSRFIENVKNSRWYNCNIVGSPECEFIRLLSLPLQDHQNMIDKYFTAITDRMKQSPIDALTDYLKLAESRRRIYRPLPLDEFGYTLPYATKMDFGDPFYEMTLSGQIQAMPHRGQLFLKKWTYSLAGVDPDLLPPPDSLIPRPPLPIDALPAVTRRAASYCQSLECPVQKGGPEPCTGDYLYFGPRKPAVPHTSSRRVPNWAHDVFPHMQAPCRCGYGKGEISASWMKETICWGHWTLDDYDDVKARAVGIYSHLRAKTMPVTRDPQDYWPESALEIFRCWANAGFPKDSFDAPVPKVTIPKPLDPPVTYRVRRDILSLTKNELAVYQSKIDDILQVDVLGSKWQELGILHAKWCPNYQESTFLWYRAYLLHVEEMIDFPIPYWNGFSAKSGDQKSSAAGIPQVFLEDTYIHPGDSSVRPNPLKHALSLLGRSMDAGAGQFVTRDPILTQGRSSPGWGDKIYFLNKYQQEIAYSLQQSRFTSRNMEEFPGTARANSNTFSQEQKDIFSELSFTGLFEQVHDKFRSWVGLDMAKNKYAASDPIFLSFHANMDRIVDMFLDAHPATRCTSGSPLRPFINNGTDVNYNDPRPWIYTTIGDMAKDPRALGYMYGAPTSPDVYTAKTAIQRRPLSMHASGGHASSASSMDSNRVLVYH
ncbi:hypothetical protein GGR51DRAFT_578638 [Nemania sp. FL0031]|nr:hypothetical protein GGR51DRAFT_578638 [Nemania sp. FL0031]